MLKPIKKTLKDVICDNMYELPQEAYKRALRGKWRHITMAVVISVIVGMFGGLWMGGVRAPRNKVEAIATTTNRQLEYTSTKCERELKSQKVVNWDLLQATRLK